MTEAFIENEQFVLKLSRSESLVLFEWLSRNWERTQWNDEHAFVDPAEKQILIWIENELQKLLAEPFDPKYKEIITKSYREIVPSPEDW